LSFNHAGSLTTAPAYDESGPPIIAGSGTASSGTFAGFSIGKVLAGFSGACSANSILS